jgi:leucyl-tRNA synthetase
MTYGSGAIMAVPAHDERDFAFARTFGLPVRVVIQPEGEPLDGERMTEAFVANGVMVNSAHFDGTPTADGVAINRVIEWLEAQHIGKRAVTYRLRDWLISRQRYWGAPIPIIYCPDCGTVPVPEDQLPVLLPDDVEFMPTGESPLKYHPAFLNTTCPKCGGKAQRETDTMDTFMCSSWYQLRYLSPHYDKAPFDPEEAAYWLPVDQYTGGIEHATMHLMYTRFFTKVLRDIGLVNFDEPMLRLYNQGIILGEDGEKMSKSRGNVVAPDDLVARYGSDTVRAYLMFLGRWDQGGPWSSKGIEGVRRWLYRVWDVVLQPVELSSTGRTENKLSERDLRRWTHRTIKRVSDDLETFSFNTAVAALMEFTNALARAKETPVVYTPAWDEAITTLLLLMAPFTPHIAEELWTRTGRPYSIHQQRWPVYDEAAAAAEMITLVVQVNGKVRARIQVPADVTEEQAREAALASEGVRRHLNGKAPKKIVYVPGRLVNIVV